MWTKVLNNFKVLNYKYHIVCAFVLHLLVIVYGYYHDLNHSVGFTDVDYKVFTDAARYVWNASSPYERHTYRYTPLIAILLVPNIVFHNSFGKILFCLIDVVVAFLIRSIVKNCFDEFNIYRLQAKALNSIHGIKLKKDCRQSSANEIISNISMFLWLYNPLTMIIAARGNCDSLAVLLVLATLYLLQNKQSPFYAGLMHGLAIHVRLYPIIYSLSIFMFLSSYSTYSHSKNDKRYKNISLMQGKVPDTDVSITQKRRTIFQIRYLYYLIPNFDQMKLIIGCLLSLCGFTTVFYFLYGKRFLHESIVYHLIRKDTRHNFSLYFYLQYLSVDIRDTNMWQKVLTVLPQFLLLLVFSVQYGLNKLSLNFCILIQTIVMVSFNTVVTSQYFVWILSVLPLCVWQINMSLKFSIFLLLLWFGAQATWLLPAYLLEFQGQNTFLFIWIQSVSFFCANITILGRLIKNYMLFPWEDKLL